MHHLAQERHGTQHGESLSSAGLGGVLAGGLLPSRLHETERCQQADEVLDGNADLRSGEERGDSDRTPGRKEWGGREGERAENTERFRKAAERAEIMETCGPEPWSRARGR